MSIFVTHNYTKLELCLHCKQSAYVRSYKMGVWLPNEQSECFVIVGVYILDTG